MMNISFAANSKALTLATVLIVGSLLVVPSNAEASRMHDWSCLTGDMSGNDSNREQFIRASAEASRAFNIAPAILVAIKRVESGRGLNPLVSNRNSNGTTDRGFFQVNTEVWLPELHRLGANLAVEQLHGIRENALIAGWVLRRQMNRNDVPNTLEAVGYYHKGGGTDSRSRSIRKVYKDKFVKELKAMINRCS